MPLHKPVLVGICLFITDKMQENHKIQIVIIIIITFYSQVSMQRSNERAELYCLIPGVQNPAAHLPRPQYAEITPGVDKIFIAVIHSGATQVQLQAAERQRPLSPECSVQVFLVTP